MHPKNAAGIANSVDADQTAPLGAFSRSSLIWVCTVCPDLSVRKLITTVIPMRIFSAFRCKLLGINRHIWPDSNLSKILRCSRVSNSIVYGQIWPQSELVRGFIPVLDTRKFDEGTIQIHRIAGTMENILPRTFQTLSPSLPGGLGTEVTNDYRSSQMHVYVIIPLFPENGSPSHNFSVVKKKNF